MPLEAILVFFSEPFFLSLAAILLLALSAKLFKFIRERRVHRAIEKMSISKVKNPDEKDEEAYQTLNEVRTEIWKEWSELKKKSEKNKDTEVFTPNLFFGYVMRVSEKIAAIYYPEIKNPHYLARIEDLTTLNTRVFSRVTEMLEYPFLKKLKKFNLDTIFKLHKFYSSPLAFVFRDRETRKALRRLSGAINIINPWYWLRQYLTEYSIETATRYFMVNFITIVGEEAVILYGDKQAEKREKENEKLFLLALIKTCLKGREELSSEDYEDIYQRIFAATVLDDYEKIDVMKYLAGKKKFSDGDCPLQKLDEQENAPEFRGRLEAYARERQLVLPPIQLEEKGE